MKRTTTDDIMTFNYNSSNVERVISTNQINEWVNDEMEKLNNKIDNYVRNSDLVFINFTSLSVQFSYTKKVRGASYIELPEKIKLSRACVSIKNLDFKYIMMR